MEKNNEETIAMQLMLKLKEFQNEIIKSMNYMRGDIHELKDKIIDLRQELRDYKEENNKRWEENNRRWEENDRRWKENTMLWEENKKCWAEYRENRKNDKKALLDILTNYDISISEQLGDPNVEKMRKII